MTEPTTTPQSQIYTCEYQYLDLLAEIRDDGYLKETRNGKVYSIFGKQITHDFKDGFPLLTTKKMSLKNVFAELRWFLDGGTDIRDLWKQNCHIWDNDWYNGYKKSCSSPYSLSEMQTAALKQDDSFHHTTWSLGPIYGHQWRNWGGVDQIAKIINTLKTNPDDRRMLVSAWNVGELDQMALVPCHHSWQVWTAEISVDERFALWNMRRNITTPENTMYKHNVNEEDWEMFLNGIPERKISLLWNQRSVDVPLGLPYNIASYAMLLMMLADETNMIVDRLIGNLGDCHIYENQMDGVEEQLKRLPTKFPNLSVKNGINAQYEDLTITNYNPQPTIKFPLS